MMMRRKESSRFYKNFNEIAKDIESQKMIIIMKWNDKLN